MLLVPENCYWKGQYLMIKIYSMLTNQSQLKSYLLALSGAFNRSLQWMEFALLPWCQKHSGPMCDHLLSPMFHTQMAWWHIEVISVTANSTYRWKLWNVVESSGKSYDWRLFLIYLLRIHQPQRAVLCSFFFHTDFNWSLNIYTFQSWF